MGFNFEKLLNDSMMRIYDKYKDRDDSLDTVIDINVSEEGDYVEDTSSTAELYGDEDENFTFIRSYNKETHTKRNLIRNLTFNTLYDFLFTLDTVDEILEIEETVNTS